MHIYSCQHSFLFYQARTISYVQWQPTPDNTGPIVRWPMGLPITAGCDAAGFEPGTAVMPHALKCSALQHCATPETLWWTIVQNMYNLPSSSSKWSSKFIHWNCYMSGSLSGRPFLVSQTTLWIDLQSSDAWNTIYSTSLLLPITDQS